MQGVIRYVGTGITDIGRFFKAVTGRGTVARALGSAVKTPAAATVHGAFAVSADMLFFALADKTATFSEKIAGGKKGPIFFDFMRDGGWMAMQKQRDFLKRVFMTDSCFNSNTVGKSHLFLRKIAFHLPAPFCAGSGQT